MLIWRNINVNVSIPTDLLLIFLQSKQSFVLVICFTLFRAGHINLISGVVSAEVQILAALMRQAHVVRVVEDSKMPRVPCGVQSCEPQDGRWGLKFDPQQPPHQSNSGLKSESMSRLNTSTVPSCCTTTRFWWAARFDLPINLRSIGSSNLHIIAFMPNRSHL